MRWEAENTIDELKTHLLGRKTPIRSLRPREVVQEIYGWLIGHYALRSLMLQAADVGGISPLRLSFTGTLRVIRRSLADFQDIEPDRLPFFFPPHPRHLRRAASSASVPKQSEGSQKTPFQVFLEKAGASSDLF